MYHVIMVPLDGTAFSRRALPWALALAQRGRTVLRLVHVPPPPVPLAAAAVVGVPLVADGVTLPDPSVMQRDLDALGVELAREAGIEVVATVEDVGDAEHALRRHAEAHRVDLVVMATHGRGGVSRALLGSVADAVVRHAASPVLLVHPPDEDAAPASAGGRERAGIRRVLVPLDGTPESEAVLPHAAHVCEVTGAACALLRVTTPALITGIAAPPALVDDEAEQANEADDERYLETIASRLSTARGGVETSVVRGASPAAAIADFARETRADLVVMATHARGGVARAMMGSTLAGLLRAPSPPVLVVRSGHGAT